MGLRDQLKPKQSKLTTHQQAVDGDAPATYLTGIGRYYDKLEFNDRALKCSVPEPVQEVLRELAAYYDSDQRFLSQGQNEAFLNVPMYSCSTAADNRTTELGKNDHELKVWVPEALVSGLDQLGERMGISR